MGKVVLILDDKRRAKLKPQKEKRKSGYLLKEDIDPHIKYLQWEYENTRDYIKDKEKKKLMMMAGSFTALSILVSILGLSAKGSTITSEAIFTVILFGITILNISIIKHIICFKTEIVRSTRQVNCIRQAMQAMLYAKIHGEYPSPIKRLDLKTSAYGEMIGRHIKFPIENDKYREKYESKSIRWKSADFLTVYMIAAFTSMLALYPVLTIIFGSIKQDSDPQFSAILGGVGGVIAIVVIWVSGYLVNNEIAVVLEEMGRDTKKKVSKQTKSKVGSI